MGTFLNVLQRNCDAVGIANLAQVVNVLAPIWVDPEGIFRQTIYWPFYAATNYSGPIALDVHSESDGFAGPADLGGKLPYLDVSASVDEAAGKLFISVVNRHKQEAMEAQIEIHAGQVGPEAQAHVISGEDAAISNSFAEPENVTCKTEAVVVPAADFCHTFPAHSMTVLELSLT